MPISIQQANRAETQVQTRMPFRYGIAAMTAVPHVFVRVTLSVDGASQDGVAADHLPPKWFTKNPASSLADDVRDMRRVIDHALHLAGQAGKAPTVFDLWERLYRRQKAWAADTGFPPLLWGFGVSLVERAMIDAFCRATHTPFPEAVRRNTLGIRLETLYEDLSGMPPREALPSHPLSRLIVRHTVGLSDPLTDGDIAAADRLDDGLPQSLAASIRCYGLTHFKIKLAGDARQDCLRLKRIAEVIEDSVDGYAFTLDGNENYHEIEPFRALWNALCDDPSLSSFLDRLIFIEQPLHRDIALSDRVGDALNRWADRPPVIIDESDGAFGDLPRALAGGYAGMSHKNCKGVFKGIANAGLLARFQKERPDRPLILSGEDLSNIGPVALLQDLAVHATLGIGHVERNGHHYFAGLSMFPAAVQEQVLRCHGDLYRRHERGYATLDIRGGRIDVGSVVAAPFGVGFEGNAVSIPAKQDRRPDIERIRRLARVLDDIIRIPGTDLRLGLDALIGLIPGYGDALGMILSGYILLEAARSGAPARLLVRMAANVAVELLAGAVPVLGDLFDVAWKANTRNVRLLQDYVGIAPPARRWATWRTAVLVAVLVAAMLGLSVLIVWLVWAGLRWVF
jgi:hypothetical protein